MPALSQSGRTPIQIAVDCRVAGAICRPKSRYDFHCPPKFQHALKSELHRVTPAIFGASKDSQWNPEASALANTPSVVRPPIEWNSDSRTLKDNHHGEEPSLAKLICLRESVTV